MATVTVPLETRPGKHAEAKRLAGLAEEMGMAVTHASAGGWLRRSHLIVATGSRPVADRFRFTAKHARLRVGA